MADISDLPMLHDIDADYSPQYVKLARILRDKIESGQYQRGDVLPAADLAQRVQGVHPGHLQRARDARREPVRQPPRNLHVLQRHLAGGCVMGGRRRRVDEIPAEQFAIVGANIRTLRLRKGWTQAKLGELMGWPTTSTVCAAEGHRDGRQRGFTAEEVQQLAAIFGDLLMAAHDAVRELRRAPAGWVRLPDMRSPPVDMKPSSVDNRRRPAVLHRCWVAVVVPGSHTRMDAMGATSSSVMTKRSPIASCVGAGQCAAGRARSDWPVQAGRRIGWMSGVRI